MISQFTRDESGAVTADYVVMTGGVVGLGLAVMSLVAGGLEDLSIDIFRALGTTLGTVTLVENDFSNGRGDWIGGRIANFRGFGDVLLLERGGSAQIPLDFPEGAREGILTFDVIAGDSHDLETAFFYVDGQLVADLTREGHRQDNRNYTLYGDRSTDGIDVSFETLATGRDLGGSTVWQDDITRVTVRLENPPGTMRLATHSNNDQHENDEFYAIDNFSSSYR